MCRRRTLCMDLQCERKLCLVWKVERLGPIWDGHALFLLCDMFLELHFQGSQSLIFSLGRGSRALHLDCSLGNGTTSAIFSCISSGSTRFRRRTTTAGGKSSRISQPYRIFSASGSHARAMRQFFSAAQYPVQRMIGSQAYLHERAVQVSDKQK